MRKSHIIMQDLTLRFAGPESALCVGPIYRNDTGFRLVERDRALPNPFEYM